MAATAAAGGLLLGDEDRAFGLAIGGGLHGDDVGPADAEVMMHARGEHRALEQRAEDIRQQEVGDSFHLIAGGGVAGDLQAELAQMLYRPPNLGARSTELFCDTGAADDHGGVVAQQTHNASQSRVSGTIGLSIHAGWGCTNQLPVSSSQLSVTSPDSGSFSMTDVALV